MKMRHTIHRRELPGLADAGHAVLAVMAMMMLMATKYSAKNASAGRTSDVLIPKSIPGPRRLSLCALVVRLMNGMNMQ